MDQCRARPRALLANEVLVAEGKPLESVYLVLDGRFEEYRDDRPWAERAPYELIGGVGADHVRPASSLVRIIPHQRDGLGPTL